MEFLLDGPQQKAHLDGPSWARLGLLRQTLGLHGLSWTIIAVTVKGNVLDEVLLGWQLRCMLRKAKQWKLSWPRFRQMSESPGSLAR